MESIHKKALQGKRYCVPQCRADFLSTVARGNNLAQKQEIICYINLRHYSGTVVAISTAGAFAYEVTRETTDLVTITDLILKMDLII